MLGQILRGGLNSWWRCGQVFCSGFQVQRDSFLRLSYTFLNIKLKVTKNVEFNELKIYPNPSNGNWNIKTGNADVNQISIFSITGKLIQTIQVNNQNEIEIQAVNLDAGMYMIQLNSSTGNSKTLKLVKQ